jgi:outer membrane biosynthesis protein TonB
MRARRLRVRAGGNALRATVGVAIIAGLISSPAAPAKKPETAKLPPGLAKRGLTEAPGLGVAVEKIKTPKAVAPVKAAKPAKPVKVKAAKPERQRSPKQVQQAATPPAPATPSQSQSSSPVSTAAPPAAPAAPTAPAETTSTPKAQTRRPEPSAKQRRTASKKATAPSRGSARAVAGTGGSVAILAGDTTAPLATTASRERRADVRKDNGPDERPSPIVRTVRDIVETVPGWMKLAIAALGALALLFAGAYAFSALRARSLARQRSELLGDVGLLQRALLPTIPDQLGGLAASVAYRPADGPGAGGDFYDALPLSGGRVGFVLGDVSGHGRAALERTAFMRYTLRAYLEAGLEPSTALQVAGRVIGDGLDGDFATVLLAIHDPNSGSLTYATAGHPAPIIVGATSFEPVIAGSSPPIGVGEPTGLRQTTVPLVPGAVACFYTDGLIEARIGDGLLGRERLQEIVEGLGPEPTATELLERVAAEAVRVPDDMATCVLTPTARVTAGGFRTERLELTAKELDGPLLDRFLAECGVPGAAAVEAAEDARRTAARFDGAVVSVAFGGRRIVDVLPRNVASIESAVRRAG